MWIGDVALGVEMLVIAATIIFIPYTEIDWRSYMQEVHGFLGGELQYVQLRGDTGPLVYPGGFVWLYSALYYITKAGEDLRLAQWIFAGVYCTTLALVLEIYRRAKLPWTVLIVLFVSKRIRSLYVLRLFNDCWAMLFLYYAVLLFARRRQWMLGCLIYSMAVSIKMNILLFSPGLLYVLLRCLPLTRVIVCLSVCAGWQLLAGLPFLMRDPGAYLNKSFELGRVFIFRWSVNFQCFPGAFANPILGHGLLLVTVAFWTLAWRLRWSKRRFLPSDGRPSSKGVLVRPGGTDGDDEDAQLFSSTALTLFESNMIGIIFSRSIHYQFYVWFFHMLPFMMSYTRYPRPMRLLVIFLSRQAFEMYPPTCSYSLLLLSGFCGILMGIIFFGQPVATVSPEPSKCTTSKKQSALVAEKAKRS